jgi:hypothetical protein
LNYHTARELHYEDHADELLILGRIAHHLMEGELQQALQIIALRQDQLMIEQKPVLKEQVIR